VSLGGALRLSCQNHVESGPGADQAWESLAATGAGNQPELDLGKAEHRLGMVGRDPIVAGQRDLQAPAQTGTVNGCDDRLLKGFQAAHRFLALEAESLGLGLIGDGRELFDIGAGNEIVRLAGDEHHRSGGGVIAKADEQ
jgi:hypothetical protein